MEKKQQSTSLTPPPDKHLEPFPVHSRMVTCNQMDSPLPPKPGKFRNVQIKVQVENKLVKKRKFEDTNYESPKIKPISPNTFSPDLGCFMDYSSCAGRDSLSTFTPSPCNLNKKTQAPVGDLQEVLGSPVHMKHADLRYKLDSKRHRLFSGFDNDVDDIFCLNPLGQDKQQKFLSVSSVSNRPAKDNQRCPSETALKQQLPQEAPLCSQYVSFQEDLNESITRPLPGPASVTGSCLEGFVKEGWNIGAPRFESSVCEGSPTAEHRNKVEEDSVFVDELSTTGDSLWETTLPLQVQVKSKVVVPSKISPCSTRDYSRPENRPTVYSSKSEWEHQSRQYVNTVMRHMREDQGTTRVLTELQDLMSSVSGQSRSHGARWQHPSDLTRRNYQQRFNEEKPLVSLSEWQRMNGLNYNRFATVPKIFQRSSTKY